MKVERHSFEVFDRDNFVYRVEAMGSEKVKKEYVTAWNKWKNVVQEAVDKSESKRLVVENTEHWQNSGNLRKRFWSRIKDEQLLNSPSCIAAMISNDNLRTYLEWHGYKNEKMVDERKKHNSWLSIIGDWIKEKKINTSEYKVWTRDDRDEDFHKYWTLTDYLTNQAFQDIIREYLKSDNKNWVRVGKVFTKDFVLNHEDITKEMGSTINDLEWLYSKVTNLQNDSKQEYGKIPKYWLFNVYYAVDPKVWQNSKNLEVAAMQYEYGRENNSAVTRHINLIKKISVGDIIVAYSGSKGFLGYGKVTKAFFEEDNPQKFIHVTGAHWRQRIGVNWTKALNVPVPYKGANFIHDVGIKGNSVMGSSTIFEITPEGFTFIKNIINGSHPTKEDSPSYRTLGDKAHMNINYFVVISNPETWTVDEIKDGGFVRFTAYNDNGNRRNRPVAFEKIKAGDLVVFYESSPALKAVAIGETVEGLHKSKEEIPGQEVDVISLKYTDDINPVSWADISIHDVLKDSLFVRQGARGTLFELTKEQYLLITNWDEIPEKDIETLVKIPTVDFNIDSILDGLVFENIELLMEQVKTALSKGKHIILTGPPGTGKSKLASRICDMYGVPFKMVTASSNWSTYETIGGYRPDKNGKLFFNEGTFLKCFRNNESKKPENTWLIIDEINRADIDKAFGSLFSVLTGDEVTLPFESESGTPIVIKPQRELKSIEPNDFTYFVPNDWRIIATMNTIDKASLYEMSYAFMRRFAFIPVGVPKNISNELIRKYLKMWDLEMYQHVKALTAIWKLVNNYRKIGPAIVKDIAKHTEDNDDFTSAIILYVLPQFEGLSIQHIKEFVGQLVDGTDVLNHKELLRDFVDDFFDAGGFE